jgi:hypothetical protein
VAGVGHRLLDKAGMKLARYQACDKSQDRQGKKTQEKVGLFKQDQILYHCRPMKSDRPCNVSFKTCYADAHVSGIAPFLQKRGKYPDKSSYTNYSPACRKKVLELTHLNSPFISSIKTVKTVHGFFEIPNSKRRRSIKSKIPSNKSQTNLKSRTPNSKPVQKRLFFCLGF